MRDPIRAAWWLWGGILAAWFVASDYLGWHAIDSAVDGGLGLILAYGYLVIAAALGAWARPYWKAIQPTLGVTFFWSLVTHDLAGLPSMLLASLLATVTVAAFRSRFEPIASL